jgi:hypothetical protein
MLFNALVLIIEKYNLVHLTNILFYPVFGISCYFIFKNSSEKAKKIFLWSLMILVFVLTWATFATDLITDYNNQRLNFWSRLPLHMCSINVILFPLFFGLRKKVRPFIATTLFAYMYFVGSPGALLAMVVTAPDDCLGPAINLLSYNVFVYWLKHGLIFMIPILMVSLGFYRPKFKDIFKAVAFLIILLGGMELVNLLFSWFAHIKGGSPANYFYTRTGKGTLVLETFWKIIPIELLYMFPLAIIAIPIFIIYDTPFLIYRLGLILRSLNKKRK